MGKSDNVKNVAVHANVHIGDAAEVDGYGLSVDLKIEGVQDQDLIDAAHQVSSDIILFLDSSVGLTSYVLRGVAVPVQSSAGARCCRQYFQGRRLHTPRVTCPRQVSDSISIIVASL